MDSINNFVKSHPSGVSVRTIAKKLGLKRRFVQSYVKSSENFVKVEPEDVGSYKTSVNVWKSA